MSLIRQPLGDILLEACREGCREVALIVPFVKQGALEKLLNAIQGEVEKLFVVVRWRPLDIASGVSDIEIFDLLKDYGAFDLRMHNFLHAKYYRFDEKIFIGSANLSDTALGWRFPANEEILILSDKSMRKELLEYESRILSDSSLVTQETVNSLAEVARGLREQPFMALENEGESAWLPLCRRPKEIFKIINGKKPPITKGTYESALKDIASLNMPVCKDERSFKKAVSTLLKAEKVFQDVRELAVADKATDEKIRDLLEKSYKNQHTGLSSKEQGDILIEWVEYFMSDDFHIISTGQRISLGGVISDEEE